MSSHWYLIAREFLLCCVERQNEDGRRTALTHALTHSLTHALTHQHSSSRSYTIHSTCLPTPPGCSAQLCRSSHTLQPLYMWTVLHCDEARGQTDGRPQLCACIVWTYVNTVILFKYYSTKQQKAVHFGTYTVFWNNPNRPEWRALRKQGTVQCRKWLPTFGPETCVFLCAMWKCKYWYIHNYSFDCLHMGVKLGLLH